MGDIKKAVYAKYIFLDVVQYTHNRSVEAQCEIISSLNAIVKESSKENRISSDDLIYLPTGDGLCIVLLNLINPVDIHLNFALSILKRISEHNSSIDNKMREFEVRIGINENQDNIVKDINGKKNIAGDGINTAQRIMNAAGPSQVLVGLSVYDKLRQRENYLSGFREYEIKIKHGYSLNLYQYVNSELDFLNNDIPEDVKVK